MVALNQTKKESLCFLGLRLLLLVWSVSWLIVGNVNYFQNSNQTDCDSMRVLALVVIIFGYFEMFKCCILGLAVCICVPVLIMAARRQQRPDWMPAAP